jgi:hypothetical protein
MSEQEERDAEVRRRKEAAEAQSQQDEQQRQAQDGYRKAQETINQGYRERGQQQKNTYSNSNQIELRRTNIRKCRGIPRQAIGRLSSK